MTLNRKTVPVPAGSQSASDVARTRTLSAPAVRRPRPTCSTRFYPFAINSGRALFTSHTTISEKATAHAYSVS